ncbi:MAG: nitroreductase family protein [Eubacteriales bacterium]
MDFLSLAESRFSVRNFLPKEIETEKLEKILQAGHLAPTGKNTQPQRILVMNNKETLDKLKECTKCHFDAPLALLLCYDPNDAYVRPYDGANGSIIDASIVGTHMMLEATDLGLGSTWVMHYNPEKMREAFAVPENFEMCALLVIGYPSDAAKPLAMHTEYDDPKNLVFYNQF